jgi:hypothetical protein
MHHFILEVVSSPSENRQCATSVQLVARGLRVNQRLSIKGNVWGERKELTNDKISGRARVNFTETMQNETEA